jgi:hypothetical protein
LTTIPAVDRFSSMSFETPAVPKALALASRKLAELKGVGRRGREYHRRNPKR